MDTLKASKMLKRWVAQGVLLKDDSGGKRHTVYFKHSATQSLFDWDDPIIS